MSVLSLQMLALCTCDAGTTLVNRHALSCPAVRAYWEVRTKCINCDRPKHDHDPKCLLSICDCPVNKIFAIFHNLSCAYRIKTMADVFYTHTSDPAYPPLDPRRYGATADIAEPARFTIDVPAGMTVTVGDRSVRFWRE